MGLQSRLASVVLRPRRHRYSDAELGPAHFRIGAQQYERSDLHLRNSRGHMLCCSHFHRSRQNVASTAAVVYCHGASGSRCDALEAAMLLLPYNIDVFGLDFAGSGQSEGSIVSFGWHEQVCCCAFLGSS